MGVLLTRDTIRTSDDNDEKTKQMIHAALSDTLSEWQTNRFHFCWCLIQYTFSGARSFFIYMFYCSFRARLFRGGDKMNRQQKHTKSGALSGCERKSVHRQSSTSWPNKLHEFSVRLYVSTIYAPVWCKHRIIRHVQLMAARGIVGLGARKRFMWLRPPCRQNTFKSFAILFHFYHSTTVFVLHRHRITVHQSVRQDPIDTIRKRYAYFLAFGEEFQNDFICVACSWPADRFMYRISI